MGIVERFRENKEETVADIMKHDGVTRAEAEETYRLWLADVIENAIANGEYIPDQKITKKKAA